MRLPGATDDWSLPDDLWLNSCPYRRSIRDMFYTDVVECLQRSVADPDCPRLMRVVVTPPELNMEMDSYRVGPLLVRKPPLSSHRLLLSLFPSRYRASPPSPPSPQELVREAALGFAEYGLNCRVCVQGSMGQGAFQGVPRGLSGVNKLLQLMDWQAGAGQDVVLIAGGVEHVLLVLAAVSVSMVPAIPTWVADELKRRDYDKAEAARLVRRRQRAAKL